MERFEEQSKNDESGLDRDRAFEQLQRREHELLKTNEIQIKLAHIFFPEEETSEEKMMKWATSEEGFSAKFRQILEQNPDILKRVMKDDESIIDDIVNLLTH
jgi:hypothetical protein